MKNLRILKYFGFYFEFVVTIKMKTDALHILFTFSVNFEILFYGVLTVCKSSPI